MRNVFLLVTIPTHLRTLLQAADLLHHSGRYQPVMLYYPSAVFEQNIGGCQDSRHPAFVWTGRGFVARDDYLSGNWRCDEDDGWADEGKWRWWGMLYLLTPRMPRRGLYLALYKKIPLLPSPSRIGSCIQFLKLNMASLLLYVGSLFLILRTMVSIVLSSVLPTKASGGFRSRMSGRSWLRQMLLQMFARAWRQNLRRAQMRNPGPLHRVMGFLTQGPLHGLVEQKSFHHAFSRLIEKNRPVLLVLPEENLFYDHAIAVHAAHKAGVPCCILPFTIVNTLEWAEAFYNVAIYQADHGWNRLYAKAFPHWVLDHRGRRLILPALHILGCEYLDVTPDHPWLINSGKADAIAAESQFMCAYYRRAGIRSGKIILTGSLSDDHIHKLLQQKEQQRMALSSVLGLEMKGRVVLIGLPPDQFGAGKRPGCEFDRYEDMVRFMVSTVSDSCSEGAGTVLINLHPRVERERVAFLERSGARIVSKPIEDLIPLADLYIAVASATIRLAIACGIPVVNFDAYQYDYDDFKGLDGVREVKTQDRYRSEVSTLIKDKEFHERIRSHQQELSREQYMIDGKAGKRVMHLFDSLAVKSNHGIGEP